jgi:hypothetical protein
MPVEKSALRNVLPLSLVAAAVMGASSAQPAVTSFDSDTGEQPGIPTHF